MWQQLEADVHSEIKLLADRVQQSGHAVEWKELHATLDMLERTQGRAFYLAN